MPTLNDLFSPNTVAAAVVKRHLPVTRGKRRVSKSEEEVSIDSGAAGHDLPDGSFERIIALAGPAAMRACPCPGSNEYGGAYDNGAYHYPSTYGTFADHVIIGCEACDAFWKVPYEIKSEDGRADVITGEPEARVRAFLAPAALADAIADPSYEPEPQSDPVADENEPAAAE